MSEKTTNNEEERYVLTPWGCLCAILDDYGFNTKGITAAIGGHMVEDFMTLMVLAGHVTKEE